MGLFSIFKRKNLTKTEDSLGEAILLTKSNFTSVIVRREIPETDEFKLEKLFVEPGKYFRQNQTIMTLGSQIHGSGILFVRLPFGGRVEKIHLDKENLVGMNKQVLSVTRIEDLSELYSKLLEQNIEKLDQTEISILSDDFTGEKTIKFTKVAGEDTSYFKLYRNDTDSIYEYLGMSFINYNGVSYLSFLSIVKEFSLAKGDSITFLFDNKEGLELVFNSSSSGESGRKSNYIQLTSEHLNIFLNKNLVKAKIVSSRKNLYDVYVLDNKVYENEISTDSAQYLTEKEGQYLLKMMTSKFIKMNLENKL